MSDFTPHEIKLAKSGYCFHSRENRSGKRPTVRDLLGMTREDVIFDESAFKTHQSLGIKAKD